VKPQWTFDDIRSRDSPIGTPEALELDSFDKIASYMYNRNTISVRRA
jgi:hypothetical protein